VHFGRGKGKVVSLVASEVVPPETGNATADEVRSNVQSRGLAIMRTHSSPQISEPTTHRAALRFRQLLGEISMLLGPFPDLRDAFDPDDLPIAFILKRDSVRSQPQFRRPERTSAHVNRMDGRRSKTKAHNIAPVGESSFRVTNSVEVIEVARAS
jgi:hypothetical protein